MAEFMIWEVGYVGMGSTISGGSFAHSLGVYRLEEQQVGYLRGNEGEDGLPLGAGLVPRYRHLSSIFKRSWISSG